MMLKLSPIYKDDTFNKLLPIEVNVEFHDLRCTGSVAEESYRSWFPAKMSDIDLDPASFKLIDRNISQATKAYHSNATIMSESA